MERIYLIVGFITFWGFVCVTVAGLLAIVVSIIKSYKERKRYEKENEN